jgi:hypothetical protein
MEQLLNEIKVPFLDKEINRMIAAIPEAVSGSVPSAHYNQHEDLFVLLDSDFVVPRLPVHHDMAVAEPEPAYIAAVRDVVKRLIERMPAAFQGLTYYFDPTETFKLPFFRLYKVEDSVYIYLLRIDINCHSLDSEIIEPGQGNHSAVYKSNRIFAESILLPLESVSWEDGQVRSFRIRQLVSNTYMGEEGRTYFGKLGIWKDSALTKFFSRLVLPEGVRTYPFFPLSCKYRTVCAEVPFLGPHFRKKALPLLHRAISFLSPEMAKIENSLKSGEFSDKMPLFAELRGRIPAAWKESFQGYSSRPYLNDRDMKEFALEVPNH